MYISVKFCQHVAGSYLHIFTYFGGFILIFNKMALIFLGVPTVFNVFTALHGMQSRYSDGNSVCPSVRPSVRLSVKRVDCDKTEENSVHIFIPRDR